MSWGNLIVMVNPHQTTNKSNNPVTVCIVKRMPRSGQIITIAI